jgi:hypothetical protein
MSQPKRYKPIYRSMTVASALLMVAAFGAATFVQASPEITHGILVIGLAAVAVYLRRGLIEVFDEVQRLRSAAAQPGAEVPRRRRPKRLMDSWTVRSATLMVAAYFIARAMEAPPYWITGIQVVGVASIALFLRRAMIEIFRDST